MKTAVMAGCALVWLATTASATTYYVNSATGNDSNFGTSSATPWKTLTKVNSVTFSPGDTILFAAGGQWGNGTSPSMLWPKGTGNSTCSTGYLKIDMYNTGAKPKIIGGGAGGSTGASTSQAAVYLKDQSCWEIRNLDVSNSGHSAVQLSGIKIENSQPVVARHIYVGSNTIHDVTGIVNGFYASNAGIAVVADMNTANPCPTWPSACPPNPSWTDVTIENNTITGIDRIGIYIGFNYQAPGTDPHDWTFFVRNNTITIRGNALTHLGADGILTLVAQNVLIDHNTLSNSGSRIIATRDSMDVCTGNVTTYANCNSTGIWTAVTDTSTIQFNEVYNYALPLAGGKVQWDGQAFDTDEGTTNQTIQFNYSHNNQGGMLLTCEVDHSASEALAISGQVVRYNISYNDISSSLTYSCVTGTFPVGVIPSKIENNLFVTAGVSNGFIASEAVPGVFTLVNNIFYVRSGSASFPTLDLSNSNTHVSNNMFFGAITNIPAGSAQLLSDPLLVQPEGAGFGTTSLNGLRLATGSPALDSGLNNGSLGTSDFWGDSVPAAPTVVHRGPYNGVGLARGGTNVALGATATLSPNTSYELEGWGALRVTDGRRDSTYWVSEGVSSQAYSSAANTVDLIVHFAGVRAFSQVTLFPRDDDGWTGAGFPVDFTIDAWNGFTWVTRVTRTGYAIPSTGQSFTWGGDTTDRIRIHVTKLGFVPTYGYCLELAEVEVY